MKSSKWILGLMVVVLVMALAPSSFAQVQISIFNTASSQEVATARNAQTSDITSLNSGILVSGALIANSPLSTTSLFLTFPAPITSSTTVPAADALQIQGASGLFASASISTINFSGGVIELTLHSSAGNSTSGTFRVVATRIDVNGKTAPLSVTASLSSSSNNYILSSNNSAVLINALGAGIGSMTQSALTGNTNNGTALMFTNQSGGTFADSTASVVLTEGFASAWRSATQASVTGAALFDGHLIRLTIGGLPAGVTATLSQNTASGTPYVQFRDSSNAATATASLTSTTTQTWLEFYQGADTTKIESIQINVALTGTPTATLTPGSITLTATMAPTATTAFSSGVPSSATSTTNGILPTGYPRFAGTDVGPLTIGSIVAANTTALIPYAVKVGAYDTGIAIANTTADPFTSATGGATKAAGGFTVTLFPRTATGAGTPITITTSSTVRPGVGLATDGTLAAGGTWTALLSDLLTASGTTGDFFGYIFIQANFLNAHGAAYIFNGAGFTSSTPVLVLLPPAATSRNTTGAETLNF